MGRRRPVSWRARVDSAIQGVYVPPPKCKGGRSVDRRALQPCPGGVARGDTPPCGYSSDRRDRVSRLRRKTCLVRTLARARRSYATDAGVCRVQGIAITPLGLASRPRGPYRPRIKSFLGRWPCELPQGSPRDPDALWGRPADGRPTPFTILRTQYKSMGGCDASATFIKLNVNSSGI